METEALEANAALARYGFDFFRVHAISATRHAATRLRAGGDPTGYRCRQHARQPRVCFIRKTGVPLTDHAVIDWRFFRHGDVVTVLMVATDPVYLVEPEVISKSFRLSRTPLDYRSSCVTIYEGREPGSSVPHYLPEKNPFVDEFVKLYHLPTEAVLGSREALYPEYRKKIKHTYVPPPPCNHSCGQAGNFVLRP